MSEETVVYALCDHKNRFLYWHRNRLVPGPMADNPDTNTAYFYTISSLLASVRYTDPDNDLYVAKVIISSTPAKETLSADLDGPGEFVVLLSGGHPTQPWFLPADTRDTYTVELRNARRHSTQEAALWAVRHIVSSCHLALAIQRVVKTEPAYTYTWELVK